MFDKKDFEVMKKDLASFEDSRDSIIRLSRDVVRLSKKVIYACHREDLKDAKLHIDEMRSSLNKLSIAAKDSKLRNQGTFRVAVQEYVEAVAFFHLLKHGKVPTHSALKADTELYLLGIIDLVGELVRKAINSSINSDYQTAVKMKDLVSNLYDELLLFDFSGGELRKKFDSIKYDLKKLEDLVLNLKLNGKI